MCGVLNLDAQQQIYYLLNQVKIQSLSPKRVICVGLGPIGLETCKLIAKNPLLRLVGLVDKDTRKVRKDLGFGMRVEDNIQRCVRRTKPHIAFLMTSSRLPMVAKDLETLMRMGVDVVSSCEELSFPWLHGASSANRLDRLAKKAKRRIVGTGVNPGFVMDALPLMLSSVCQSVESIRVTRIVDVAKRRLPLQQKMAVGQTKAEFQKRLKEGKAGHVGLKESVALIAQGMGWKKLRLEEKIGPILAQKAMKITHFSIRRGAVIGIRQSACGFLNGRPKIILELSMCVNAREPRDEVHIAGTPPVHVTISPGVQGDLATAACLVNAALKLNRVSYGLLTVKDLPAGVN